MEVCGFSRYQLPAELEEYTQKQQEGFGEIIKAADSFLELFSNLKRAGLDLAHSLSQDELMNPLPDAVLENITLPLFWYNSEEWQVIQEPVNEVVLFEYASYLLLQIPDIPQYLRLIAALNYKEECFLPIARYILDPAIRAKLATLVNELLARLQAMPQVLFLHFINGAYGEMRLYLKCNRAQTYEFVEATFGSDLETLHNDYEGLVLIPGEPHPQPIDKLGNLLHTKFMKPERYLKYEQFVTSYLRERKLRLLL